MTTSKHIAVFYENKECINTENLYSLEVFKDTITDTFKVKMGLHIPFCFSAKTVDIDYERFEGKILNFISCLKKQNLCIQFIMNDQEQTKKIENFLGIKNLSSYRFKVKYLVIQEWYVFFEIISYKWAYLYPKTTIEHDKRIVV